MKDRNKRIDGLLDGNAAEQLAKVDWDRLTHETSVRLARAEQAETSPSGYPTFFRVAAAIAATAAVVFVAVVFRMHGQVCRQSGHSFSSNHGPQRRIVGDGSYRPD